MSALRQRNRGEGMIIFLVIWNIVITVLILVNFKLHKINLDLWLKQTKLEEADNEEVNGE